MPFSFPLFYFLAVTCAAVLLQTVGSVLVVLIFFFHFSLSYHAFSFLWFLGGSPFEYLGQCQLFGLLLKEKKDTLRSVRNRGTE